MIPASRYGAAASAGLVLLGDERAERTPEDHVEERPDARCRTSGPGCATARGSGGGRRCGRGARTSSPPRSSRSRARWRNTPSRSPWPKRAATSAGAPSATTRPASTKTTRSQRRSTSGMLCEVTRRAVPSSCVQVEQAGADPVGDVGVERGGGLVEHEQPGPVQRRLDDADQRALARRELHAGAVGEVPDPEPIEAGVDGVGGGRDRRARRSRRRSRASRTREPVGERQVAGDEADLLHRLGPSLRGGRWPRMSIVPPSGVTAPRSISSVVVLPAPLGPSRATRSPALDGEVDAVDGADRPERLHAGRGPRAPAAARSRAARYGCAGPGPQVEFA